MRKQPQGLKELGHPVIAPGRLADLSLYSKDYTGFVLVAWPADVPYPSEAKTLGPSGETGQITGWLSYKILAAFCIGSLKDDGKWRLMRFCEMDWCKHSYASCFV